MIKPLSEAAIN